MNLKDSGHPMDSNGISMPERGGQSRALKMRYFVSSAIALAFLRGFNSVQIEIGTPKINRFSTFGQFPSEQPAINGGLNFEPNVIFNPP
jgi:hypothetical protein